MPETIAIPAIDKVPKHPYSWQSLRSKMGRSNKCSVSYGLIVKTASGHVVTIQRKVPYCVQNYYILLNRRKKFDSSRCQFKDIREQFENEQLPLLTDQEREDYDRFQRGCIYEDLYDFPHGQYQGKRMHKDRFQIFLSAYREFQEESGYRFTFKRKDVYKYPLFKLDFIGGDGNPYTQYFFVVENVNGLRRYSYFDSYMDRSTASTKIASWKDDRLTYQGKLMNIEEAFNKLWHQQKVKKDYKYLFCYSVAKIEMFLPKL